MSRHHRRDETAAGERSIELSLAVRLVDGATGERPLGEPSVFVAADTDRVRPNAVNPSGYWVYLDIDLPPDPLRLVLDGGDHYADDRIDVTRPAETAPAVRVELAPAPQYPFGPGATIVRGVVVDPQRDGVADAVVTVRGLDRRTRTNSHGEFILFFGDRPVEEDTTTGVRRVTVDGSDPVVDVSHERGDLSEPLVVEAGTVTRYTFVYE